MNNLPSLPPQPSAIPSSAAATSHHGKIKILIGALLALGLAFSWPAYQLVRFALGSELYSHVILIPFVSAYLVWLKRSQLSWSGRPLYAIWPIAFIAAAAGFVAWYFIEQGSPTPHLQNALAFAVYALVLSLTGICCWLFTRTTLRTIAFPLGFLVCTAPFPLAVEAGFEKLLQHGSSMVAQVFFQIIGTPVFREGTFFHLPGFKMQVAPECSGIHSTLVLFITSLFAGQLLLRSNWSRTLLILAVLPIALLRNGLRVTTIGELCIRIGPEMIDSFIHRHGGPIFFAISLVPFSLLLFFLLKRERRANA